MAYWWNHVLGLSMAVALIRAAVILLSQVSPSYSFVINPPLLAHNHNNPLLLLPNNNIHHHPRDSITTTNTILHFFWRDRTNEEDEASTSRAKDSENSSNNSPPTKQRQDRLKTDFDRLFLGTPSMQDILGGVSSNNASASQRQHQQQQASSAISSQNEAWFQEQKKETENYYQRIFDQMSMELAKQRQQDPAAVPSNAEDMLQQVLMEEMKEEIESKRRATLGLDDPENEVVTDLSSKRRNLVRNKASPPRVAEYQQYEFDAVSQQGQSGNADDEWSLDKLQRELQLRQEEEEERRAANEPETMKEWQMLRAISTRAGILKEAEEEISTQFQSWKDYVAKEEEMRKQAGLARGPKLPFAWQEVERDQARKEAEVQAAIQNSGGVLKSREQVREEVNEKSITALEELIRNSDPIRSARLRNTLLALKKELEVCRLDENGDCEEAFEEALQGELNAEDLSSAIYSDRTPQESVITKQDLSFADEYADDDQGENYTNENPQEPAVPPPKTAFFSDDEDYDDVTTSPSTEKRGEGKLGYSLGSIEEQKLRAQFQKAGARTNEEKASFRAQWEEFQRYEKSMRDESGLSDNVDDSGTDQDPSTSINVADLTNEDGDFDAAKILASIGPRPTRRKNRGSGSSFENGTSEDDSSGVERKDD